jgi:hypothetical protein
MTLFPNPTGGPMRFRRFSLSILVFAVVLAAVSTAQVKPPAAIVDPVLAKMIDLGLKDNQVMTWLDFTSNRFGGRYTGTDAYANGAA